MPWEELPYLSDNPVPMTRLAPFLVIVMISACSRQVSERLEIAIPEVQSKQELELIRNRLLEEQELLPDRIVFYHSISTSMTPKPRLILEVDPQQLRLQNVYVKIHELGYTVDDRSGDPVKRMAFLTRTLSP